MTDKTKYPIVFQYPELGTLGPRERKSKLLDPSSALYIKIKEMAANRPHRYVLEHGLFVNNIPDTRLKEKASTHSQSCKF